MTITVYIFSKNKVNWSLHTLWSYVGGVEVKFHSFLTSA